MITYCKRCLIPDTKPSIRFNADGICSACQWHDNKNSFYKNNKQNFKSIVLANKTNPDYDCIIPVSGGKDSTYQVWRVLKEGLNPLCVTAPTDFLTPIGRQNIENIKSLGVDHIEVSVDPTVRRKINRYALTTVGDIQWPEHVLIFTIPVQIAVKFNIPIIIWGENSVREYGAGRKEDEAIGVQFTREYMEENCGFNGLRVSDLSSILDIPDRQLSFYRYPDDSKVEELGVKGLFLDDFFPWNGMTNQLIARSEGFQVATTNILGTLANHENLDNYYHGIHDYMKYLKYGFSRSTDLACNWIRRDLLTREDAIHLVSKHDGAYPSIYLDMPLSEILKTIDMDKREFDEICDLFTNYALFKTDDSGKLLYQADGSPELKEALK